LRSDGLLRWRRSRYRLRCWLFFFFAPIPHLGRLLFQTALSILLRRL